MIVCLDVHYRASDAVAAGVLFGDWTDAAPCHETTVTVSPVAPYQPGQFYKRELPCLQALLNALPVSPKTIVVDGYVWLADETRPGLGGHLYQALGRAVPVIGVAKTSFAGVTVAHSLVRGSSATPLYITAAGLAVSGAADCIAQMHGPFRLPTLLKRVDQLCRGRLKTNSALPIK
jgi:deoxyribonuclease V